MKVKLLSAISNEWRRWSICGILHTHTHAHISKIIIRVYNIYIYIFYKYQKVNICKVEFSIFIILFFLLYFNSSLHGK